MRDEWSSPYTTDSADHNGDDGVNDDSVSREPTNEPSASGEVGATYTPTHHPGDDTDGEAAGDALSLRVERIGPAAKGVTPRQLTRALLVATLIALLVGGAVSWPTLAPLGARAFSRAHDALFPPPATPRVWRTISPSYAQSVAFGVNAPLTGYLCGEAGSATTTAAPTSPVATPAKGGALGTSGPPSADDLRPITLGVSGDAGRSWRTQTTPAHGSGCALGVNPTDARDIVLLSFVCALCDATQVRTLVWRSRDGGRSWGAIAPPSTTNFAPGRAANATMWPLYIGKVAWAGDALYLAAFPSGAAKAQLAVCRTVTLCSWIDLSHLLTGEPPTFTPAPLSVEGMQRTLYVQLTSQERCPPACVRDAISSDGGATWAPFAPTFRGQPVQPSPESHGAPDLLGYYQAPGATTPTLLSSLDGGVSWRIRPNPPASLFTQQILETPDGSIFAWLTSANSVSNAPNAANTPNAPSGKSQPPGIYALAPNTGTWRLVAPEQVSQTIAILAFSCDAHGHALAIWGQDLSQVGVAQPALFVHWLS